MRVAYLCDGKACGDICPNPDLCYRTEQIEHAINFIQLNENKYIEKGIDMDEMTNTTEETAVNPIETREISEEEANEAWKKQQFARRRTKQFYELIKTIFSICNLSGFRVEGHIRIKDLKTGKVYE